METETLDGAIDTPNVAPNREQWLSAVLDAMRRDLFAPAGFELPANVKVTCGFPSRAATSRKKMRIGECWDATASNASIFEVLISPMLDDALTVAATVAHEGVHATVGLKCGHKGPFAKCAKAIGLEGKMTATVPSDAFKQWFAERAETFGAYPHSRLNATSAGKKQAARLLKCACDECELDGEPYIVRISAKTFAIGAPICPVHNVPMSLEGDDADEH